MKLRLMVFLKKKKCLVGVNGPLWAQNYSASSSTLKNFKILHIERGQEAHKNHILI